MLTKFSRKGRSTDTVKTRNKHGYNSGGRIAVNYWRTSQAMLIK
jgi:hypothetical protein